MIEQWKKVSINGGYEVSNNGRVRSVDRLVKCKNGFRTVRGQVLSAFIAKNTGYCQVSISGRKISVHRLVATAWCDGYFDGACVDHVNGVRDDNRSENLEWVTPKENQRRSWDGGKRAGPTLGKMSRDHNSSKAVVSTDVKTGETNYWPSAMDAVREGFDSSCISRCCNSLSKQHKGKYWRFAEVAA